MTVPQYNLGQPPHSGAEAPVNHNHRHCEEGKARRGNPHLSDPGGAGRRNAPQGVRIATGLTPLAMTVVVGGWSFYFTRAIIVT